MLSEVQGGLELAHGLGGPFGGVVGQWAGVEGVWVGAGGGEFRELFPAVGVGGVVAGGAGGVQGGQEGGAQVGGPGAGVRVEEGQQAFQVAVVHGLGVGGGQRFGRSDLEQLGVGGQFGQECGGEWGVVGGDGVLRERLELVVLPGEGGQGGGGGVQGGQEGVGVGVCQQVGQQGRGVLAGRVGQAVARGVVVGGGGRAAEQGSEAGGVAGVLGAAGQAVQGGARLGAGVGAAVGGQGVQQRFEWVVVVGQGVEQRGQEAAAGVGAFAVQAPLQELAGGLRVVFAQAAPQVLASGGRGGLPAVRVGGQAGPVGVQAGQPVAAFAQHGGQQRAQVAVVAGGGVVEEVRQEGVRNAPSTLGAEGQPFVQEGRADHGGQVPGGAGRKFGEGFGRGGVGLVAGGVGAAAGGVRQGVQGGAGQQGAFGVGAGDLRGGPRQGVRAGGGQGAAGGADQGQGEQGVGVVHASLTARRGCSVPACRALRGVRVSPFHSAYRVTG
ncbi:hypothetical protein CBQ26_15765 [Deinococcus indicus]|uniref:Uncharacterized protein n=1 Tax=Deinococcus indicus TaxID=223556 RepID=A0A246BGG4_9DEIO|nr:hypothetical protein CBQ26_15765 [Deinococcus indicus]